MSLPDLNFLFEVSVRSLQEVELAALNRSANLSKAVKHELDLWVEKEAEAMLARWFLDNREALLQAALKRIELRPKKVELLESSKEKKLA